MHELRSSRKPSSSPICPSRRARHERDRRSQSAFVGTRSEGSEDKALADLVEAQAHPLADADDGDAAQHVVPVAALRARAPLGLDQALAFVEAQGRSRHPRSRGHRPDREPPFHIVPLDLNLG